MPLIFQENVTPGVKLALWHITEPEDFFHPVNSGQVIHHPHKRLQHLAGRHLLRVLVPEFPLADIVTGAFGKPVIPGDDWHFSISHCGDYAAVLVSAHGPVGLDIEIPVEKILRIRHKFIDPGEQVPDTVKAVTAVWSIKEACFKWYAKGRVDFRQDMVLQSLDLNYEDARATIQFGKDVQKLLHLQGRFLYGLWLWWVV